MAVAGQRLVCLVAFALSAWSATALADTLRCGSNLISTGDRAFEVERKCGEPVARDLVGYTLGPYARREVVREEWVYGPSNGAFNILTFEGNRLVRIETSRAR
jgi:hypothetical protein